MVSEHLLTALETIGLSYNTATAIGVCAVATASATVINPRGWMMWVGFGTAMAIFAMSSTDVKAGGSHLGAAFHVAFLVAIVAFSVGVGLDHIQRWTQGTSVPSAVWMVATGLLSALAAMPAPVTGGENLAIGVGLTVTCLTLLLALSAEQTTPANDKQTSLMRGAMTVLIALPVAWTAATRMPETAYTDVVGHLLASVFVVALLALSLLRFTWAPWFLAAAVGVGISGAGLLVWPLIWAVCAWSLGWAIRTSHPSTNLLSGAAWVAATVGGVQAWHVMESDRWEWWVITMGLVVAVVSAVHTIPPRIGPPRTGPSRSGSGQTHGG